jgi:hypothetical protein
VPSPAPSSTDALESSAADVHRSVRPSLLKSADSFGLDSRPMGSGGSIDPNRPLPSAVFRKRRTSPLTSLTVARSTQPSPSKSVAAAP